jgi:hypothetical protein
MRRHVIFMSLLVVAGVVASGAPAGAGSGLTPKQERFCTAFSETDSTPADPSGLDGDSAHQSADNFRSLAKVAPTRKVKRALKTTAAFFDAAGDAADSGDAAETTALVTSSRYRGYVKAIGRVSKYYLGVCLAAQIPDGVSIPTNPNG